MPLVEITLGHIAEDLNCPDSDLRCRIAPNPTEGNESVGGGEHLNSWYRAGRAELQRFT